jgi:flagellar protein FlaG
MQGTVSSVGTGHLPTGLSPVVIEARDRQGREQRIEGVRLNPPKTALPEPATQTIPKEMTPPQAVAFANIAADLFHTNLSFDYDERTNQVVVKVMDDKTGQVIRQIPPEHMVQLMASFKNDLRGLILNHHG